MTSFDPVYTYSIPGITQIQVTSGFPKPGIATAIQDKIVSLQLGAVSPVDMHNFSANIVDFGFDSSSSIGAAIFSDGQVYSLKKVTFLGIVAYYNIANIYNHSVAALKAFVIDNSILFTQDANNVIKSYDLVGDYALDVSPVLYSPII